ncbi:MAG TPA: hypothetical protein VKD72_25715 [Gemmataceae bacterium]|nr:hypothetical protein [Gemmataceae bacterium]
MSGFDERMERLVDDDDLPPGDDIVWPEPREDLDEEPSHGAARIADRERGVARGDVEDE